MLAGNAFDPPAMAEMRIPMDPIHYLPLPSCFLAFTKFIFVHPTNVVAHWSLSASPPKAIHAPAFTTPLVRR